MMCNFSQRGYDLLKVLEGYRLSAYQDSGGIWTIGYGQTGNNVHVGSKITQLQADQLLHNYIINLQKELSPVIKVQLNQNQQDAIIIFVYNIGINKFNIKFILLKGGMKKQNGI